MLSSWVIDKLEALKDEQICLSRIRFDFFLKPTVLTSIRQ